MFATFCVSILFCEVFTCRAEWRASCHWKSRLPWPCRRSCYKTTNLKLVHIHSRKVNDILQLHHGRDWWRSPSCAQLHSPHHGGNNGRCPQQKRFPLLQPHVATICSRSEVSGVFPVLDLPNSEILQYTTIKIIITSHTSSKGASTMPFSVRETWPRQSNHHDCDLACQPFLHRNMVMISKRKNNFIELHKIIRERINMKERFWFVLTTVLFLLCQVPALHPLICIDLLFFLRRLNDSIQYSTPLCDPAQTLCCFTSPAG